MNPILSLLLPVVSSLKPKVLFDLIGPNGELPVHHFPFPWYLVFIIIAAIIIVTLIVAAVKVLMHLRKNKNII